MTTLGAIFVPQNPPERLHEVVRAADDSGLDELWLWEDCFFESGIASASAALAWTERVRVGVGLLPVPLRNVALTAMEIATLERLFPGRFQAGVGHGVQDWMRQVGAAADSPLTLLREYVTALRAILHGDEVTTVGRYVNLDRVVLDWPPSPAPPVLAGATGPKSLRACGELADGVILDAKTSIEGVRDARRLLDEARAAGPLEGPVPITLYLAVSSADPHEAAADVHRMVTAGADKVVLEPTATHPDAAAFVRFAAREVAPLVH